MAKINIKRPDGTRIVIEGGAQEVAELVRKIEGAALEQSPARASNRSKVERGKPKKGLVDLLIELRDSGFFKAPKDLGAVKTALAEHGEIYPATTISPVLLRLVRGRHIRRIKQDKRWFYTG